MVVGLVGKKREVSEALRLALSDNSVVVDRPERIAAPCVSFYEADNSPAEDADDCEYISRIGMVVDVWAKTSLEADSVAIKVDKAMKEIGFSRVFFGDVPSGGVELRHKTSRYEYIGG